MPIRIHHKKNKHENVTVCTTEYVFAQWDGLFSETRTRLTDIEKHY